MGPTDKPERGRARAVRPAQLGCFRQDLLVGFAEGLQAHAGTPATLGCKAAHTIMGCMCHLRLRGHMCQLGLQGTCAPQLLAQDLQDPQGQQVIPHLGARHPRRVHPWPATGAGPAALHGR